ncbi:hypothetical protein [Algibacter mikhailovii]|uniref:SGNH/GDSL hydrolase family protein n=1 Tax=Algibacter mikhailovii TaxID=425498 RepID=A0A918R261_9FLAO|nr:hypothetical protein [Algibacter mikhailovii]GGZ81037.1 hypothetical protein GCM10007028_18080 [Algibacter mikhailovii]
MKKFFEDLLKLTVIVFLFYCIGLFVFNSLFSQRSRPNLITKLGHNNVRLQEVKQCNDLDILFFGSSHAYRGFDTRKFIEKGYRVFNLGSSAQTPLQTDVLMDRYLNSTNPKLVIIEVYPMLIIDEGVESSIDLINNDLNDFNSFELVLKQKNIKVLNSFLYRSLHDLLFSKIDLDTLPLGKEYHYHEGGYISRDLSYYKYERFDNETLNFPEDQLKVFDRVLEKLNQSEINYILVQAPITNAKYNSILNNAYFDSLMQTKGKYYNFNELVKLDDSLHFYDYHHLNQNGVDVFNKKFIDLVLNE